MRNIDFSVQIKNLKKERALAMDFATAMGVENFIDLNKFQEHVLNTDTMKMLHSSGLGEKLYCGEDIPVAGNALFDALVWSSIHQFCFWYNPYVQNERGKLTSGIVHDMCLRGQHEAIPNLSLTLRKERYYINQVLESFDYNFGLNIQMDALLKLDIFNFDFFKKKKNLFFMQLIRYREELTIHDSKLLELDQVINPAIDYQIPKMLRDIGVITYPHDIGVMVDCGEIIQKDSYEELFIRSITYFALVKIQEVYGYSQNQLDWLFWSTRNNSGSKYHCTITEDY